MTKLHYLMIFSSCSNLPNSHAITVHVFLRNLNKILDTYMPLQEYMSCIFMSFISAFLSQFRHFSLLLGFLVFTLYFLYSQEQNTSLNSSSTGSLGAAAAQV